jgi:hypothetical protein
MSDVQHDAAQQAEQDRLAQDAAENEAVRRAEHPEEFAGEQPAAAATVKPPPAPVEPAATGEQAEQRADDLSTLQRLEQAAGELRRKLFEGPTA